MSPGASVLRKAHVVNLIDDAAFGGVTRALGVFETPAFMDIADAETIEISPSAMLAPRLDADIMVLHFPPNWRRLGLLATLRLRNPHARIVHIEHSYTQSWETLNVPSVWRFRLMLWIAMRLVHKVVCVSQGQADWLAHAARLARQQIDIIHPYAENPGLSELALPVRKAGRPLRIGAYGRFCEQKGFDVIIGAFRNGWFPDCELILGGFGPDDAMLKSLATGLPSIKFVGKVTSVAKFMSQCDAVAIPSRWEAYGMVAFEAREAGRPILASAVDGLLEHAARSGVLVDFTDQDDIAIALGQIEAIGISTGRHRARSSTQGAARNQQRKWVALISDQFKRAASRPAEGMPCRSDAKKLTNYKA